MTKRSAFPKCDGFNAMLMAIAQEKKAAAESNARYHKENAKVDKVVDLVVKWRRACEAWVHESRLLMLALNLNNFWREKKKRT